MTTFKMAGKGDVESAFGMRWPPPNGISFLSTGAFLSPTWSNAKQAESCKSSVQKHALLLGVLLALLLLALLTCVFTLTFYLRAVDDELPKLSELPLLKSNTLDTLSKPLIPVSNEDNVDEGFGEESTNLQPAHNDEDLTHFFLNSTELLNKPPATDPLDGEFVEHRTMSSEEMEEDMESVSPQSPSSGIDLQHVPSRDLETEAEQRLSGIPLHRFCSQRTCPPKKLVDCASKFVLLARVSEQPANNTQEHVYTLHVQQVLRKSPLLSAGLRRSKLHVRLDASAMNMPNCNLNTSPLQEGRIYLISGRVAGLHAISSDCDLRLDWQNDVDIEQRQRLLTELSNDRTSAFC